jgi:hypothetical protein
MAEMAASFIAILRAHHRCGAPESRTFKGEHQVASPAGAAYDGATE